MAAACAAAVSLFTASAATCTVGTLASYVALGSTGCTIDGLTFSGFMYTPSAGGGASLVLAGGITVTPQQGTGEDGFFFNADWSANSNQFSDGTILFTVSTGDGGPATINDAAIAQVGGISGTGSGSVAEYGCAPTSVTCNPVLNSANEFALLTFDNSSQGLQAVDGAIFTPTGILNVAKDIGVSGGTDGFATISKVADVFSVVPEPREISLLLALCFIAGLAFRKKLQNARG
jgi:hypothetical protein